MNVQILARVAANGYLSGVGRRFVGLFPSTMVSLIAVSSLVAWSAGPVAATPPVKGILMRSVSAAPSGANGVRVSIFGDKTGGKVQVRLLSAGQDGVLSGYYGSNLIPVNFEGWKTITIPFSEFKFGSDTNPGATKDGLSSTEMLAQAARLQLVVIGSSSRVFFNGLAWASGDSALAPIDSFEESSVAQWKSIGDYDQLRSVRYGSVKAEPYVKDGKPSLQFVVRANLLNEAQINRPVVDKALNAQAGIPYAVYARSPFDTVFAESVPAASEIKGAPTLSIMACPGQREPITFSIYAAKELKNATVTVNPTLQSDFGLKLPVSAVDVRVVRVGESPVAPELLMKDDRQSLSGISPTVRLIGDPTTDIPAGTSKRFWVTVTVPTDQAPGFFKGKLRFVADKMKPTDIPLTIEVPDLTLKTAFLQYGIELKSQIGEAGGASGGNGVTPELFKAQLENIRDHGFKLIVLTNISNIGAALQAYRDANMSKTGPVLIAAPDESAVSEVEKIEQTLGLPTDFDLYYLASDNVRQGRLASYDSTVRRRNRNQLTGAYIETLEDYAALSASLSDKNGERLAAVYPISSEYVQKIRTEKRRSTQNRDYWTWNIPAQSPNRNRLLAGYLLFQTGPALYGALPGPYQDIPAGSDPYAELNPEDSPASMTTFPVSGGVLDTVQWEAVRSGVDDIRYIGALKSAIRDLKDVKKRKDLTDEADAFVTEMMKKDLLSQTPAQVQANRIALLKAALNLKAAMAGKSVSSVLGATAAPRAVAPAKPKPPVKKKAGK